MTGYFDRMVARALGREPRLVLRRRSPYEPAGNGTRQDLTDKAAGTEEFAPAPPGDGPPAPGPLTLETVIGEQTDGAHQPPSVIGERSDSARRPPSVEATGQPAHRATGAERRALREPGSSTPGRYGPVPVVRRDDGSNTDPVASQPEPYDRERSGATGTANTGDVSVVSRPWPLGEEPPPTLRGAAESGLGAPIGPLMGPPAAELEPDAATDARHGVASMAASDDLANTAGNALPPAAEPTPHPVADDHRTSRRAPRRTSPPGTADRSTRGGPEQPSDSSGTSRPAEPGRPPTGSPLTEAPPQPPHIAVHHPVATAPTAPTTSKSQRPGRARPSTPPGTEATAPAAPAAAAARPTTTAVPDLLDVVHAHVVPALVERGLIAPGTRPAVHRAGNAPAGPDIPPDRPTITVGPLRIATVPDGPSSSGPGAGDVHVHIDQIDVHPPPPPATQPPVSAPQAPHRDVPPVDLAAYLAARRGERR